MLLKRRLFFTLRVLLGITIVLVLAWRGGRSSSHLRLDARSFAGGTLAIALLALALLLSAMRWKLVLGRSSAGTLTLWRYYLIGWRTPGSSSPAVSE